MGSCKHHAGCQHQSPGPVRRTLAERVRKHGFTMVGTFSDDGSLFFVYTIGLTETWGHPELAIAGLEPGLATDILNRAASLVKTGTVFRPGGQHEKIITDFPALIRRLDLAKCHVGFDQSDAFYGRQVDRLQLLWPDPDGVFPGNPDCDTEMALAQAIGG